MREQRALVMDKYGFKTKAAFNKLCEFTGVKHKVSRHCFDNNQFEMILEHQYNALAKHTGLFQKPYHELRDEFEDYKKEYKGLKEGYDALLRPFNIQEKYKERQPSVFISTGAKGTGKTYRTVIEIRKYGEKRPVLVFDTNLEADYADFLTVRLKNVHKIQEPGLYKVVPSQNDGTTEKKEILHQLLDGRFRNGLLLLEDLNSYLIGARSEKVISAITTNRQKNLAIFIQLQNTKAIDSRLWQNCNFLRMHFQTTLVDSLRSKDELNFELIKIAQLIVNEQHPKDKYFYLYLDLYNSKLLNVNKSTFSKAAKAYLSRYKSELRDSGLTLSKWINQKAKLYL